MKVGIVPLPPTKGPTLEYCKLGFVDLENPPNDSTPLVVVEWQRNKTDDWNSPTLQFVKVQTLAMGSLGSILSMLERLKQKKDKETGKVKDYFSDPANLIYILNAQPSTKICVWDERVKKFVSYREAKSDDDKFIVYESEAKSDSEAEPLFTVTADSVETAKTKALKRMADQIPNDTKWVDIMSSWVRKPRLKRQSGLEGDPPELVPIETFYRRSAQEKKKKKNSSK